MGSRSYAILVALVLCAGLAPTGTAQKDVDIYNWGVPYFLATGKLGSAHFSLGPGYDAKALLPFDGCASILARPAKGLGAVDAVGLLDGANLVEVKFDEFRTPN